jgi:catechol 2,3-dioxygenase
VTDGVDRLGRDGHVQIPKTVGQSPGLGHVAWEMENEAQLVEGCTRARAAGAHFQRTLDHQVAHSAYFADPDGNSVEFYCDTVPEWRRVLQGDMDLVTARWDPWGAAPSQDRLYDTDPERRVVAHAPVQPSRLSHVVLTTDDVPALARFYAEFAGLTMVFEAADGSVVCLGGSARGGEFDIAICRRPAAAKRGYHHIAFVMDDAEAVAAAEARVEAAGGAILRRIDDVTKRSFFLADPDGQRIEFLARRQVGPFGIDKMPEDARPFLI